MNVKYKSIRKLRFSCLVVVHVSKHLSISSGGSQILFSGLMGWGDPSVYIWIMEWVYKGISAVSSFM